MMIKDEELLEEVENIVKDWLWQTKPVTNVFYFQVYDVDERYKEWNDTFNKEHVFREPSNQITIFLKWQSIYTKDRDEGKYIKSDYKIGYDELRLSNGLKDFIHSTLLKMHMDALGYALNMKEDK
jgi:hypothetical protein